MTDTISREHRSWNMSRIRGKNTKPEMTLRSFLHRAGLRFRLHSRDLPGRPDLIFPRYRTVVFVHGCFWHNHHCSLKKFPSTNAEFWKAKLTQNSRRDEENKRSLINTGWKVITIWECAIRGKQKFKEEELQQLLVLAIKDEQASQIEFSCQSV